MVCLCSSLTASVSVAAPSDCCRMSFLSELTLTLRLKSEPSHTDRDNFVIFNHMELNSSDYVLTTDHNSGPNNYLMMFIYFIYLFIFVSSSNIRPENTECKSGVTQTGVLP